MGKTQTLQLAQQASVERIAVSAISKIGVLVPPWTVLGLLTGLAAVSHAQWGAPPAVTWATMAGTLSTVILTALTWAVSHQRGMLGRVHSTATTGFSGLWFTVATITGVTAQIPLGMLFFGGGTLAVGWNIRAVIRQSGPGESGHGDPLGNLFNQAKETFGLKGATVRTTHADEYKIKGKMALPAGQKVADDIIKNADYIESGMQFPPGSVIVAKDEDDASQAHITVSDPRIMKKPIPWPGPSRPGGSIDDPLRTGLYQDMTEVSHRFTGHHLQIMGMSGSGKSIGGAWNYLAEITSRHDTAVFFIDVAKEEQTIGPLIKAIHKVALTPEDAANLLRKIHAEIPKRTQYLARTDLVKWAKGCGLQYWFLWIEELPKLLESLDNEGLEMFEEIVKEIRSAGGSVVSSLQRADYTQVPTLLRSQMAKMCFGVADADDVKYGTTKRQRTAEVSPEDWTINQPGMAYLDVPGTPGTHYAMPLRTFAWGATDQQASAAMRAHAEAFPADAKPMDEFTRRVLGLPADAPAGPSTAIPMPPAPDVDQDEGQGHDRQQATTSPADMGALVADAAELVIATQFASPSMLQRKLRLPHADCLRVLEALERKGVVGPHSAAGDRDVLIGAADTAAVETLTKELRADGDVVSEYLRTEDPDPSITASPDDVIRPPAAEDDLETPSQGPQRKMSPEAARGMVHDWIRHRAALEGENAAFSPTHPELEKIRTITGMTSRGWIYKVLNQLTAKHVLTKDESGPTVMFTIHDLGPLDDDYGKAA